ncbi:hypothetical protein HPB47_001024 [Ixodes persulcatus]|uniref:Uncharacterized protein n=1 Tax=Ixodes persulcatus TaxID=34615 RepID=A0AC60PQ70_IXOPE|nr:hypothetical protein HPB47_001024 [Ixodes persulcatus]
MATNTQGTDRTGEPPYTVNHYAHQEIWFLQVEGRFGVSNVTSQTTRFGHLVAALPNEVALEVHDILSNPPTAAPYDTLKAAILERTTKFASSEETTALREEVKNLTTLVASSLARHSEPSRNSSRCARSPSRSS